MEEKITGWRSKISPSFSMLVVIGMIVRFCYTRYLMYQAGEDVDVNIEEVFG